MCKERSACVHDLTPQCQIHRVSNAALFSTPEARSCRLRIHHSSIELWETLFRSEGRLHAGIGKLAWRRRLETRLTGGHLEPCLSRALAMVLALAAAAMGTQSPPVMAKRIIGDTAASVSPCVFGSRVVISRPPLDVHVMTFPELVATNAIACHLRLRTGKESTEPAMGWVFIYYYIYIYI